MQIGHRFIDSATCEFVLWAPKRRQVELKIISPQERVIPLRPDGDGYWVVSAENITPGTRYVYRLDGDAERPDPASFSQPDGVHSASEVLDHGSFRWSDDQWKGMPLSEMIMYEMHIGTFTDRGTFDAVIPRLDEISALGINAIEIMPVAQYPGERNWGYDGVYPFAVQNSYGGAEGFRRLVNECHKKNLSVILDVVYNHLGPEGNYLRDFGPYFTDRYRTPWGSAINFDGAYSDGVRNYFIENALYWFEYFHIDALRLDAIHGIFDMSARPFLLELSDSVKEFSRKAGRRLSLIAESDLNNSIVVRPQERGGYGLDGTWCDDFHHCLHTLLTGDHSGYYVDFGTVGYLEKSLNEGYVYSGQYSKFRKRAHGNFSGDIPVDRFVVFAQNHDQVGNRMKGERLSSLVSFEALKLSAGTVVLSPYVPLLFMGEEYGDPSPFLYFVSHSDPPLIEAVREGRRREFDSFKWQGTPPDPSAQATFESSKLQWKLRSEGEHRVLLDFYRELLGLRRQIPALSHPGRQTCRVWSDEQCKLIFMERRQGASECLTLLHFNKSASAFKPSVSPGVWEKILDSSDSRWNGPGAILPESMTDGQDLSMHPESLALFRRKEN